MTNSFAISNHPALGESIQFLLLGFAVVLVTLMVLALVTGLVGKLFVLYPQNAKPETKAADAANSPVEVIDTRLLAVISAAVHVVFKEPVRITKVVSVRGDPAWSHEGRRQIQQSHNIR